MKQLKSLSIKNFQSHKDTTLEFDSAFTIITGDNGSGKTALLRVLDILLYGASYPVEWIRNGEKDSTLQVTFTDGSSIIRYRTKTVNKITFIYADGTVDAYTGTKDIKGLWEEFTGFKKVLLDKASKTPVALQYASVRESRFLLDNSAEVLMRIVSSAFAGRGVEQAKVTIKSKQRSLTEQVKTLDTEKEVYQAQVDKFESIKTRMDALKSKHEWVQEDYTAVDTKASKVSKAIATLTAVRILRKKLSVENAVVSALDEAYKEYVSYKYMVDRVASALEQRESITSLKVYGETIKESTKKVMSEIQKFTCEKCGRCVVEVCA